MIRLALALIALASVARAVDCGPVVFEGTRFTVCTVDPATENLRLFHSGPDGVLGGFSAVQQQHGALDFAMNAGMYHDDRAPVGLYVQDGVQTAGLVTRAGPGNFGLLPNGVLCLTNTTARVIETQAFARTRPTCRDATQSGPMLVIDGALHPRFIPGGTSKLIRNGVGTDGTRAVFAISDAPVNFDTFGRLFRDHLGTPNALYLDGTVSRLYAPAIGRRDFGFAPLGPIVGVLAR